MRAREIFRFPHPVNAVAARAVAAMVAVLAIAIVALDLPALTFFLAYGFLARTAAGPTFDPFAQLALRVVVPLLGNPRQPVAGPPKRFAQAIGLVLSVTALVLLYGAGSKSAAYGALGVLTFFAALESALGFCTGCWLFERLMRAGLIPRSVCERCAELPVTGGP